MGGEGLHFVNIAADDDRIDIDFSIFYRPFIRVKCREQATDGTQPQRQLSKPLLCQACAGEKNVVDTRGAASILSSLNYALSSYQSGPGCSRT